MIKEIYYPECNSQSNEFQNVLSLAEKEKHGETEKEAEFNLDIKTK
jgi:hypothetical protein